MAYCSQCGSTSNGAFCPQCGATLTAPQPQAPIPQQPYYAPAPPRKSNGLWIGLGVGGGVLVLGLVAIIIVMASQGGSKPPVVPATPTPSDHSRPSQTPADKAAKKPGYVTGIVLDERGAPLKVSPDKISIRVAGNRSSDMQAMAGFAPVLADGRFEMKVPDGDYGVTGFVKMDFQGTEFWMTLDPVGGPGPQNSKDGLVKEMRLKLTGQRPGQPAGNPYSYYGGHIRIQYQGATLPDDAQVKFTLTPTTPLIDGSQGKPVSFTATGKQLRSNAPFSDIPVAKYRITGEVTLANGTKKVALISLAGTQPAPSQEFAFKPNTTGEGIEGVFLWMKGEQ